jgi:hypothetical protein
MVLIRRFLLLWLLMFWLGGFTFYAAVVVPIGTEKLGSPLHQARITQPVTNWLNLAGAIALAAWAWDLSLMRRHRWWRWLLWLALVLLLAALIALHPWMDALLDLANGEVYDLPTFTVLHRVYLWISTVQWGGAIVLSYATLRGWRDADRRAPVANAPGSPKG